ncbi:hypothetical protein GCM10010459_22760 [Microbacterium schleiferi]
MNLAVIRNTNLKWFMLVNTLTTIAFLPAMAYAVAQQSEVATIWAAAVYGGVWFLSGLICGIADGASSRGLHRELAYASFMFVCAFYVLLAGRIFWSSILPLGWIETTLAAAVCALAVAAIQIYSRRYHAGYTRDELFK